MFTAAGRDWVPERLSPIEVAYHRDVLAAHTDDLVLQVCPACQVTRGPDWRDAYDRLAAAGELMATPERWQDVADTDQKPQP